ncbi:hypothetical protein CR513_42977, partial [Mucuna pruriens]
MNEEIKDPKSVWPNINPIQRKNSKVGLLGHKDPSKAQEVGRAELACWRERPSNSAQLDQEKAQNGLHPI